MLNFEFDAAWLLLPANIYHEIRKKWSTKEYAVVKRYFKFWKLRLFFRFKMLSFPASPCIQLITFRTGSTMTLIIWFLLGDKRTLTVTSYELYDFIVIFPWRIHWLIHRPDASTIRWGDHHARLVKPHNFHYEPITRAIIIITFWGNGEKYCINRKKQP